MFKSKRLFSKKIFPVILLACVMLIGGALLMAQDAIFKKSLHSTTEGMRYWYEENGGFKDVTGIPYSELDCKSCHIETCEKCHAEKKGETFSFTVNKAKEMETCLPCHSREAATFRFGKKNDMLDVHIANDMVCSDCHKAEDVHGDGSFYQSMRDTNAVRAACSDCHEPDSTIRAHTVHKGKLDCNACHVQYTTTCMNCHFDRFLETGSRKGNFMALPANVFLINYNGKVTTANVQTLVHKGEKFVAYAPYFTHSVQKQARACTNCHGTDLVKQLKKGKHVPGMKYEDGKFIPHECVVPIVADQLDWQFLDKEGENWVQIKNDKPARVQFVCYGTPLTKKQIIKMAMPFKK